MQLKKLPLCLCLSLGLAATPAFAELHNVNNVSWNTNGQGSADEFVNFTRYDNAGGVVFIRPTANNQLADQSSTNLAINDRFLVSLQDGHYTSSAVCTGPLELSAVQTGKHINDLRAGTITTKVNPREVQYFVVQTTSSYAPKLTQVDANTAKELLKDTHRQGHQISRVNPDCPPATPVRPAPQPAPAPVAVKQAPTLRLNILFDTAKSNIKPEYQSEVSKAANFLNQYPHADAIIEGHTDSVGKESSNQLLSQNRAEAVKAALISSHGIDAKRLSAVGYGESRPVASNDTADGRHDNRRVMVVLKEATK